MDFIKPDQIAIIAAIGVGASVQTSSHYDINHKFNYMLNTDGDIPGSKSWCAKANDGS